MNKPPRLTRRCPFCYAPISELKMEQECFNYSRRIYHYRIKCTFCECTGPKRNDETDAIQCWNERGTIKCWTLPRAEWKKR